MKRLLTEKEYQTLKAHAVNRKAMTNEKPILMSGEMVRAILDGRKCCTRRVVKGAWHEEGGYLQNDPEGDKDGEWWFSCHKIPASFATLCPYGRVKDRLWIKEAFGFSGNGPTYKIDDDGTVHHAWTSGRFMPRKFSRITLEIIGVKVERLQDITVEDAKAEGVEWGKGAGANPRTRFSNLWDSINAKRGYSWSANPFVWVIHFEKISS